MHTHTPASRTIEATEAQEQLPDVLRRVARERTRVMVEDRGVAVAAIVSTEDLERLDRLDRERDADFAGVHELRAAFAGVPTEEIERETDRILGINQDDGGADR